MEPLISGVRCNPAKGFSKFIQVGRLEAAFNFCEIMDFEQFTLTYIEFRKRAGAILGKQLPSESAQLQMESADLEPLRWEAEKMRAAAMSHYYKAKLEHIEKFHAEGWAVSALSELAKAKANKELWAREDSNGLLNALISRSIKISQLLKLGQG